MTLPDSTPVTANDVLANVLTGIGRLEGKVDGLSSIPERLMKVEIAQATTATEVHALQAQLSNQQQRKAPWPATVGAVVAIIVGLGGIITLAVFVANLLPALASLSK